MSTIIQGLISGYRNNLDYATRLIADLTDEQMVGQPPALSGIVMNHPAWCLSHLNVYIPIIRQIILGGEIVDPKEHRYGMQSKPEADRGCYPSKAEIMADFTEGHQQVIADLEKATNEIFDFDVRLERWQTRMPKAGIALPYLMLLHENQHLGQVSAWRRAMGLPKV
ncbi:MAG: DinB family protein [Pirellulaceae bacterium]|jgi:hypothetical protein|nr:DinB family protein [Pirellulaceae bacterium]